MDSRLARQDGKNFWAATVCWSAFAKDHLAEPFCRLVIEYVESRFADQLSLRHVADALGYSPAHLTYRFRRNTGIPVTAWIIRRRIHAAAELLCQSVLTVRDVSESVGFNDQYYFTRQFVRIMGTTPGQYRRTSSCSVVDG